MILKEPVEIKENIIKPADRFKCLYIYEVIRDFLEVAIEYSGV